MNDEHLKSKVKAHWEDETCGTRYGESNDRLEWMKETEVRRYELEPHLLEFADFVSMKGKRVLEIGVGAGVDFSNFVRNGAIATGVDLTHAGVELTKERLDLLNIAPTRYALHVADAERLPFADESFDVVYSWGVLHHTPNTTQAFRESLRVLKPNGVLKTMVYHSPSWTGFLLWTRYGLMNGRPHRSLKNVMFHHLESPGTKAYHLSEMRSMLSEIGFTDIQLGTKLCAGDLLEIQPSKKYQSSFYQFVWKFYPRWLVKFLGDRFGLELLIQAKKCAA